MTIDARLLQDVAADENKLLGQVREYLHFVKAAHSQEECDTGDLLRLLVCPNKGRECGDQSYVIVQDDGNIIGGCHGGKCQGHDSWEDFQKAWGLTFDDYLAGKKQKKATKAKLDPAGQIVRCADRSDKLFHTPDGRGFALTERRGVKEVLLIRSQEYRNVVRLRYEQQTGQVPKREHVNNAIEQLDAKAVEEGEEKLVAVRVAEHDGAIYVALGDRQRRIVRITKDGWGIVLEAPMYFRYPKSQLALPEPIDGTRHGTKRAAKTFRRFVNVTDEDWPLYLAFIVHCFRTGAPQPIAAFIGAPGHAKSTQARNTQAVVDPTTKTGAAAAKDNEDLLIAAKEGWLLVFDNINQITREMADNLCRLATGAAMGRRTKYSDADETIFVAKNPVVITAIADVITQADLLDRALRFVLSKLKKTKDEKVLEKRFKRIAAYILGYILDGVSAALRNLPTTAIADPPRMIGFALWGTAAEEGLGLKAGAVMEAYRRNIGLIHQMILESDLARKIIAAVEAKDFTGIKKKTKELAEQLGLPATNKGCKQLVGQLRQLMPALEARGIHVDPDRIIDGMRHIVIERVRK